MEPDVVEARLLGEVRVLVDGSDLPVGGPALRLVLTMLLMAVGQVVPKERLAEALWGEEPPDAESALRVNITRLRKRLAPTRWTITNRRTGYQLDGVEHLDLERLDRLEDEVRLAVDPDRRFEALLAATALWEGPALGGFRQLEVGRRLAVRLDARRRALRRTLFEAAGSAAHLQRGAAEFADWAADDPLDEIAACAHASALAAGGRTTAALRHLTRTRAALADVGLDAGRALADLELRILTNASPTPSLPDEASADFPSALIALAERPLVGRATDLAELHRAWRRAEAAGMQVMRITGPSGVGKSALLAHFAGQLHQSGVAVAFGACDVDSPRPLQVVAAIVRQLDPGFDVGAWTASGDDGPAARATVVELAAGDLVRLIGRRPTLVIVDDMRGIDELSLAVLRRMLALRPAPQAMLALAERDTGRARLVDRRVTNRALAPLGGRALQHWIGRNTSWTTADLQALTGGLPLLVEEALASGRPDSPGGLTDVGVALFEDHVSGLTEDSLDTISTAALLGSTFAVDEVVTLSRHPEMDVVAHLDAAIRRGLMNDAVADRLTFRHELFRRAAVNRWSAFRVARTHAEVVLGTGVAEHDPLRAIRHVEQAGDFVSRELAVAVALRAGRVHVAAKAYGDAHRCLALGTMRIDGVPQSADEVAVLSLAGTCASFEGDGDAAAAHFAAALAGAQLLDDTALLIDVCTAGGAVTTAVGCDHPLYRQMVTLLGRLDGLPATAQAAFLRQLIRLALNADDREVVDEVRRRMDALLARLERPEDRVRHWMSTYAVVSDTGDRSRRQEAVGEIMELVDRDPWLAPGGFAALVSEQLRTGSVERADGFVTGALASFARAEDVPAQWLAMAMQFTVEFLRGDLEAAGARSEEAHRFGTATGMRAAGDTRDAQRYYLRWVVGDTHRSVEELRSVVDRPFSFPWRCALALALAVAGELGEASRVLDGCVAEVAGHAENFLGIVGIAEAGEAAWLCSHRPFAAAARPVLAARRGDHLLLGSAVGDLGPAARYEALCLLTLCAPAGGAAKHEAVDPAAVELLSEVAADPASCPIWQLRAAVDLAAVGAGVAADDSRWAWVLHRADVDTNRLKFVDER